MSRGVLVAALVATAATASAQSQAPTIPVPSEPTTLAAGWSMLAQNQAEAASTFAKSALARDPHNIAAFDLAVEAEIARGGSAAGLAVYEYWITGKRFDDPYVLRRIAEALLHEAVGDLKAADARVEAVKALAADGDPAVEGFLADGARAGRVTELAVLAQTGDQRQRQTSVAELVAKLKEPTPNKTALITALAESHSQAAIPALIEVLADPQAYNRAAAATALGQLGARQAIDPLKALLNDPQSYVKQHAAGALLQLQDGSGLAYLLPIQQDESPMVRLGALELTAPNADATWLSAVRDILTNADPEARLEAARVIAPFDPAAAKAALEALATDPNPSIRQRAEHLYAQDRSIPIDIAVLRGYLGQTDPTTRGPAAGRLLDLTK